MEEYCLDALLDSKCAQVEEHLLICGGCRRQLVDTETYVAAMQGAAAKQRAAGVKPGAKGACLCTRDLARRNPALSE